MAIVVFVFLGKLRTTLIPLVAVPVSIVGTFAVLLVVAGANTVSLLALVLAIGIVVDDAIVVIENVERVMEEEPELSVKEATRKAMGEITAPIAITLVLLSVFVPCAVHPRHHRRALPSVRGGGLGGNGDLRHQRLLLVACPLLRPASARPRPAAGACGLDADRHRPYDRRLRLDRPPPGPGRDPEPRRAGRRLLPDRRGLQERRPQGFLLPEEDQGAIFAVDAFREVLRKIGTSTTVAQLGDIIQREPAVESVTAVISFDFINSIASSNKGYFIIP